MTTAILGKLDVLNNRINAHRPIDKQILKQIEGILETSGRLKINSQE